MSVSIFEVTDADSGTYQCVLRRSLIKDGVETFRIKVTNNPDAAVNPTFTLRPERSPPVSVKPSSGDVSTVAAEDQSVSRDPHSSTPEHQQNKEPEPSLLLLLLLLLLVPLVLMLSVVVCYKQRKSDEPGWDSITIREAYGLAMYLEDETFLQFLHFFYQLMPEVDILYNTLQKRSVDATTVNRAMDSFKDAGVVFEPCAAVTESADITYQSLCAETREHNIYSSLTALGTPPPGGQRL
uniref:Uncharacterized protein n=1 Tax=Knipowitschia caucasica TaxID=637954 RepID=A0AAV2LW04_KNICA